jgi:hypothetical protein
MFTSCWHYGEHSYEMTCLFNQFSMPGMSMSFIFDQLWVNLKKASQLKMHPWHHSSGKNLG